MANGIKKAFQTGRQNYNKLGLLKKAKDVAFDGGKKNKSKKPQSKTATKKQTTTAPVSIPAGHTKLNKKMHHLLLKKFLPVQNFTMPKVDFIAGKVICGLLSTIEKNGNQE